MRLQPRCDERTHQPQEDGAFGVVLLRSSTQQRFGFTHDYYVSFEHPLDAPTRKASGFYARAELEYAPIET